MPAYEASETVAALGVLSVALLERRCRRAIGLTTRQPALPRLRHRCPLKPSTSLSSSSSMRETVRVIRVLSLTSRGNTEAMRPYLDAGLPANLTNDKGDSLLMLAACALLRRRRP